MTTLDAKMPPATLDAKISPAKFHAIIEQLRTFFIKEGYVETHPQSRLSILAACEDPHNIATFDHYGTVYPLPQTGQMWLEHDLLGNPDLKGVFCVSTSYRYETAPIPGRHNTIFPMFEFEGRGNFADLKRLLVKLAHSLGFDQVAENLYENVATLYNVSIIDAEVESKLNPTNNHALLLTHFPERTNPFWNMKRSGNVALKCDVILGGMEVIGSAERSTDANQMRNHFYAIEDGKYAAKLFSLFGKERVENELNVFLDLPMEPRFGAGMGITRLISALDKLN